MALLLHPLFILLTIFLTSTQALITGFSAPSTTLKAGQKFTVTFTTEDSIEQNFQYYIAFGLNPSWVYPGQLGEYLIDGYGYDLVTNDHESSAHGAFNATIKLPTYLTPDTKTSYSLNAAILQSAGALYGTNIVWYNTTVWIK